MNLQEKYKKEIKRAVKKIIDNYQPEKIVLYGSCARSLYPRSRRISPRQTNLKSESDIDLLIVKKSRQSPRRRITDVLNILWPLDLTAPVEPIILTPQEFFRYTNNRHFLIEEILKQGKVLYEKERVS